MTPRQRRLRVAGASIRSSATMTARANEATDSTMSWIIGGSYFESCNCDAICPCRRIDGAHGGRSSHGLCVGVLAWSIAAGEADGVDLAGLPVAIAMRYSDDEAGSPWSWILYLDASATDERRNALTRIFTGRLGGDMLRLPWVRKPSDLMAVRPVEIEIDCTRRRQRLRIRDLVRISIRDAYHGTEQVTCAIPGHDRAGEELIADELTLADGPLVFDFQGVCGYASTFEYSSSN